MTQHFDSKVYTEEKWKHISTYKLTWIFRTPLFRITKVTAKFVWKGKWWKFPTQHWRRSRRGEKTYYRNYELLCHLWGLEAMTLQIESAYLLPLSWFLMLLSNRRNSRFLEKLLILRPWQETCKISLENPVIPVSRSLIHFALVFVCGVRESWRLSFPTTFTSLCHV